MRKLNAPQSVGLLCADDIVRSPESKRPVRIIEHVEDAGGFAYFNATDVETGERTGVRFRRSSRVTVWID